MSLPICRAQSLILPVSASPLPPPPPPPVESRSYKWKVAIRKFVSFWSLSCSHPAPPHQEFKGRAVVRVWGTGNMDLENAKSRAGGEFCSSPSLLSLLDPLSASTRCHPFLQAPSRASSSFLLVPRFRKVCVRVRVPEGWAGRVWGPHGEG